MQIRFRGFGLLCVVVCLTIGLGILRTVVGQDAVSPVATSPTTATSQTTATTRSVPVEVAKWASQLADPSFAVRQSATENLIAAGAVAIEPVKEAAISGGLEAGLRAVRILTAIYEADEDTVAVEAIDQLQLALEKLVEVGPASVAQEAAATLDRNLFTITQRRSIEAIRRFGAMYKIER